MFKPDIQVCFSPHSYPLFQEQNQVVVVVDVLRATSAICAGIANGVNSIMPVETIEEAKSYRQKGFVVAGEIETVIELLNEALEYVRENDPASGPPIRHGKTT